MKRHREVRIHDNIHYIMYTLANSPDSNFRTCLCLSKSYLLHRPTTKRVLWSDIAFFLYWYFNTPLLTVWFNFCLSRLSVRVFPNILATCKQKSLDKSYDSYKVRELRVSPNMTGCFNNDKQLFFKTHFGLSLKDTETDVHINATLSSIIHQAANKWQ